MAQAEHLPIYKASYDLFLCLEQVVRGFPRYQKYTLGTDLRDEPLQRAAEQLAAEGSPQLEPGHRGVAPKEAPQALAQAAMDVADL